MLASAQAASDLYELTVSRSELDDPAIERLAASLHVDHVLPAIVDDGRDWHRQG